MEHRARSKQGLVHARGERGGDHERNEGASAEFEKKQLNRKYYTGNRCVERRGHACSGTAGKLFTHRQVVPTALAYGAWTLVAVVLSVPVWRMMGLI
jgi:hypothetical protein